MTLALDLGPCIVSDEAFTFNVGWRLLPPIQPLVSPPSKHSKSTLVASATTQSIPKPATVYS
eukprot:scaffold39149_cov93-Skeletonema_marinoi.AAC.8